MFKVFTRKEPDGKPGQAFYYTEGTAHYIQDHWLYIIDEDGHILGFHPEVNVSGVFTQGGRIEMESANPDRPGEEGKIP